jgi:hypothetical protein
MLICGVIALMRHPRWKLFCALCLLSGMGGLIRPTLMFYGFVSVFLASLIMIRAKWKARQNNPPEWSIVSLSLNILSGIVLFCLAGAVLFWSNLVRFGSGWEFGHSLNVSPALISVYSTRFDYPFKHVPLAESARELFGALFQVNRFNSIAWYDRWIFSGQSMEVRWRGFNVTTYDLSYAIAVGFAWLTGIGLAWSCWRSGYDVDRQKERKLASLSMVLIAWSILASLPLILFYMKAPAIADRYMLDFAPSFDAALIGFWLFIVDKCANAGWRQNVSLGLLCLALGVWQGIEIRIGRHESRSETSMGRDELVGQRATTPQPIAHLPGKYQIGDAMQNWAIPYNGQGWNTNGTTECCCIFFVENPRFLELQLSLASGYQEEDSPVERIQAKTGLEFLDRESIIHTNSNWIVRFFGPKQSRYQEGIVPAFVAFVPSEDLGDFVAAPSPWILKRISWR